jgi:predicted nucleotidyltransferase
VMREADREQLDRGVALVSDVLGPSVVGAYLFRSAVSRRLQPWSDLDVFVVSNRRTTREEKQRLVDRLLAISGRTTPEGRLRRVELTIVVQSEIKPWRYPPSFDFQYGQRFRAAFESGNLPPWPTTKDPDLASLITMVLLANRPVLGPPPGEIFDPIPADDFRRAIVGDIDALRRNLDSDTRNVILTLARIWSTLATSRIRSKDGAADWALGRLPEEHRAVLARGARDLPRRGGGTLGRYPAASSGVRRVRRQRDRSRHCGLLVAWHPGPFRVELAKARGVLRLVRIGLLDGEPRVEAFLRRLRLGALTAHDEDVRIVPVARALGDPWIPCKRGPHAGHLVRGHRRTRSGPAEQHTLIGLARRNGLPDLARDVGPLLAGEHGPSS